MATYFKGLSLDIWDYHKRYIRLEMRTSLKKLMEETLYISCHHLNFSNLRIYSLFSSQLWLTKTLSLNEAYLNEFNFLILDSHSIQVCINFLMILIILMDADYDEGEEYYFLQ